MKDHTLEVPKFEGDVTNVQGVGRLGDDVVLINPKLQFDKTEALVHAAWLVVMADQSENFTEFREILKAVLET